jgi:hypothetical protein
MAISCARRFFLAVIGNKHLLYGGITTIHCFPLMYPILLQHLQRDIRHGQRTFLHQQKPQFQYTLGSNK